MWVIESGEHGQIVRIDSASKDLSATSVPIRYPQSFACDSGYCWVSTDDYDGPHLLRVGPHGGPVEVALGHLGKVRVLDARGDQLWVASGKRIVHLRVSG